MKKKLIRFDWAIKNLFKKNKDLNILQSFLSDLLQKKITSIRLCDTDGIKNASQDKSNRVDVHVTTQDGEEIIIEVQSQSEKDYFSRILYGASKAITTHVQEGNPYLSVPKLISISICYCKIGEGKDYFYKGTTTFTGQHYGDILSLYPGEKELYKTKASTVSEIYPTYYIIKVDMFNDEIVNNIVDEWIYFFKTEQVKKDFHSEGLKNAAKQLEYLKLTKNDQKEYDIFVDNLRLEKSLAISREIDIRLGRGEGREEGEKNKALEIAKNLLFLNIDIQKISKATGLSTKEIEKLK